MSLELTRHAEQRLRQRGLRECDLEFVLRHGSHLGDAIVLTNKDAEASSPESIHNPYAAGNPYRADSPTNPYGTGWRIVGE